MFYCCHTEASQVKLLFHPSRPWHRHLPSRPSVLPTALRNWLLRAWAVHRVVRSPMRSRPSATHSWIGIRCWRAAKRLDPLWIFFLPDQIGNLSPSRGVNHERPLSRPPSALSPCRMSSPPPPRGHYLIVAFDFQPSVHRFLSLDSSSHYLTVRSSLFIVYIFGGSRSNPAATSRTLRLPSDCNFWGSFDAMATVMPSSSNAAWWWW